MTVKINISTELEVIECCACGAIFAIPQGLNKKFLEKGGTFYCPVGHGQSYCENTVERLEKELDTKVHRVFELEHQLDGSLKEITRMKKRANAGVCPYCRRHFTNVERHIHHKHQDKLSGGKDER